MSMYCTAEGINGWMTFYCCRISIKNSIQNISAVICDIEKMSILSAYMMSVSTCIKKTTEEEDVRIYRVTEWSLAIVSQKYIHISVNSGFARSRH